MKNICIVITLLLTNIGCSDEYKHRDKKFSITGRLVDYQCQPFGNTDVYALNIIRSHGAYGFGNAGVNNTAKTDDMGYFSIEIYAGEWVYLGTGKSYNLSRGNILQSYDHTALLKLRTVADQGGNFVIYNKPKSDKNYSFRHATGWSSEPRVLRTPKNNLKNDGMAIHLVPIISQEGAVGLVGFNLADYIDMRIKSVESDPEPFYQITVKARESVGLLKAVIKDGERKWHIPTDGYNYNMEYTFIFPHASYPYEQEDQWKHGTFFIKALDGADYAVVSLDIGLVSSFDMELHDQYSTDESWGIAVWTMADTVTSNNYGYGDVQYRHRLPIASPYIPRRTCGGDFESTHNGTLGHHPKVYQRFFYERKRRQDYIVKELPEK